MRIAHFSDLHLLSLDGAKALDFANKRWIGGLNLITNRGRHYHTHVFEALVRDMNEQNLDHAICTGDVTNLALEQEFVFARSLFDKLKLGPAGVTVLPGNHDAYVAKGADYFTGYFNDFCEPDPEWSWGEGDVWPTVRVRNNVAIIGISTSLTTPWFTAYGVIGDEQIERLRSVLADPRLAGCFRIVAIHHAPTGRYAKSRIRGLKDRAKFAALIAEVGAELVVHGHEHRDLLHILPGPAATEVCVRGVQSCTYEAGKPDRRARYRVFTIGESMGESLAEPPGRSSEAIMSARVWDPESECFVEDEGVNIPGTSGVSQAAQQVAQPEIAAEERPTAVSNSVNGG